MNRGVMVWVVGMALLVAGLWLVLPRQPDPYDVTSTADSGTDILRRVMVDEFDRDVLAGPADEVLSKLAPEDVVLLFEDRLSDTQEEVLGNHAANGGRLVVADPRMTLVGGFEVIAGRGVEGNADCAILPSDPYLDLEPGGFTGVTPATALDIFDVPAGVQDPCWEDDGTALVAQFQLPTGGNAIVLGDARALTNGPIQQDPRLAVLFGLVLPEPGASLVIPVGSLPPPAGTQPLGSLPANLRQGMWVLAAAGAIYALGRARRHGRVLAEPLLVEVPASELAVGIAELLQRHGRSDHAANRLRGDLRADVARVLGAADPGHETLVPATIAATGLAAEVVHRAIIDSPVESSDELIAVVDATSRVRRALGLVVDTASETRVDGHSDASAARATSTPGSSNPHQHDPNDHPT